ncbi:retrovirus-related Pol polyprotein from transposon TNT 1-94 [Trichonephila clavipes]|nr:retrovirus-related Pol polyprotein from transposon TNT 1-94 [Trichonephila clavipes]
MEINEITPDTQLLGCMWVYNLKRDENGKVIRYKARLVAQVIRLFFSLLVEWLKWKHIQCDVTGAYLYAPLNEEVYMKQPQGYIERGKESLVCRLKRMLYGLHQRGRAWYFELNVLNEIGLQKLNWCNCTYFYGNSIVLLVYVDDIVIFGQKEGDIEDVLIKLKGKFNLKTMGKGILYSKRQCPQSSDEKREMKVIPYRNVLGCLSFLAGRTRPDISYAVNIFSQFENDPGLEDWYGLLKLFGYVNKTKQYKLRLDCRCIDIVDFSDADFAANRDRISMGG